MAEFVCLILLGYDSGVGTVEISGSVKATDEIKGKGTANINFLKVTERSVSNCIFASR